MSWTDVLIACWIVLSGLVFVALPFVCSESIAAGVMTAGRCVYVIVLGVCVASAAIRLVRRFSSR